MLHDEVDLPSPELRSILPSLSCEYEELTASKMKREECETSAVTSKGQGIKFKRHLH